MRITRIAAYRVELPLVEGSYKWSGGKAVTVFDSTVVRVDTDEGITTEQASAGFSLAYADQAGKDHAANTLRISVTDCAARAAALN